MRVLVLFAWLSVSGTLLPGGEYNEVLKVGDPAPAWRELPGANLEKHSLADMKQEYVVVVFTCNSCPVARDYEDRIIALAKRHADRVGVVAINVNRIPEDSLPMMRARAEERKYPFVYLFDESQKIAKDYGAVYTPEFFVLDASRKVVYMGGMDDNSNPAEVRHNFIEDALSALFAGTAPPKTETLARGCRIRYVRERR